MNQKEIGELRRRLTPEKSSISRIYGCYVNTNREVISYLDESLGLMNQKETEKYLSLMKTTLSGGLDKNLIDIVFTSEQVMNGAEHKALMELRRSKLADQDLRDAFFKRIIDAVDMKENYLLLLAHDSYDVPYKSGEGEARHDESEEVFSYMLCCLCPVKAAKPELSYDAGENTFRSSPVDMVVGSPELGFMFPVFDDRRTNIYDALFYSKDAASLHQEFIDAIFRTEPPMSSAEQRESFETALTGALESDCSYSVLQTVHEQIHEKIAAHAESKDPEPLTMSVSDVGAILQGSGVAEEKVRSFKKHCDERFGPSAALNPANIIESRKFEVKTADIKISVSPDKSCLIETRVINGRKYILIPADEGVEVNGVSAKI